MNKWDDLCATIGGHREQAEDTARLAPEVLKAAGDVGLWRLCAPLDVNGLEMPIPEQLAIYEKIGAADPTVGWHGLNTSATGLAAAWLPEPDRRDVFMVGDRPCGLGFSPSAATVTPAIKQNRAKRGAA